MSAAKSQAKREKDKADLRKQKYVVKPLISCACTGLTSSFVQRGRGKEAGGQAEEGPESREKGLSRYYCLEY